MWSVINVTLDSSPSYSSTSSSGAALAGSSSGPHGVGPALALGLLTGAETVTVSEMLEAREVIEVEGGKVFFPEERPEEFANLVADFLVGRSG